MPTFKEKQPPIEQSSSITLINSRRGAKPTRNLNIDTQDTIGPFFCLGFPDWKVLLELFIFVHLTLFFDLEASFKLILKFLNETPCIFAYQDVYSAVLKVYGY